MRMRTKAAVAGATVLALGAVGTGVVQATGPGDDDASDTQISGPAKDKAEQAALDEVGEGKVTGTEVDDEQGKYEVEVTRDDGTQVDVHLDETFAVIGTEDEGAEESESDGDSQESETGDTGNDD